MEAPSAIRKNRYKETVGLGWQDFLLFKGAAIRLGLSKEELLAEVIEIRRQIEADLSIPIKYLEKALKIEDKLLQKELKMGALVKYKIRIAKLNRDVHNFPSRSETNILVSGFYVIVAFGVALILLKGSSGHLDRTFESLLNFIIFVYAGVVGSFAYIFSKGMELTDNFIFRALMGVLFPVIFICLFNIKGDSVVGVSKLNILMFVGGYSSEFILLFLNKVVNIAKKIINSDVNSELTKRIEAVEEKVDRSA
jgi:hypothetical protein